MKITFVTDSGIGKSVGELTQAEIYSVPLQASYNNKNYQGLKELGIDEIYALMKDGKIFSISLPSLGKIEELSQGLKQQGYDVVLTVLVCSGLSGTISAMEMIVQQQGVAFGYVDCHVTAVMQKYMIKLTKQLHETGKGIERIKEVLQYIIHTINAILLPNDLQYLKRDGRLTPLTATLGGLLKIEPILKINEETNGKVDVLGKVRTMRKAMDRVIEVAKREHMDDSYLITIAHTDDEIETLVCMDRLEQVFPSATHQIIKLAGVVSVHTGHGCQAVQYSEQIKE